MVADAAEQRRQPISLRAAISFIVLMLGLMTLATAAFLVALAIQLRGSMGIITDAVESVHGAEDLEVDLLLHAQTSDPRALVQIEIEIDRKLADTGRFVTSVSERAALEEVRRTLAAYLHSRTSAVLTNSERDACVAALERFVAMNVDQAWAEDAKLQAWARTASTAGIAIAVVLLAGVGTTLIWLRRSAFRQVLEMAGVMRRFSEGARSVRARESGLLEVRAMARGFNQMAEALDRQHEAELTSLASVAHDLRNPLSALKMALAADSVRGATDASPERTRKTLDIVRRQVDKLDRMAGDLLDAARIESGDLNLRIEDCDVRPILEDVCDLYRGVSPSHTIGLEAPPAPVSVPCDPVRIEQVLGNLVSNAIKYSPSGGQVEVSLSIGDHDAVISVSDRGLGIDPDRQARIFEPFRRASSNAIPGVGLGLFVAKRIVEAHQGRIEVTSAPGEGSTFRIWLPTDRRSTETRAPAR